MQYATVTLTKVEALSQDLCQKEVFVSLLALTHSACMVSYPQNFTRKVLKVLRCNGRREPWFDLANEFW